MIMNLPKCKSIAEAMELLNDEFKVLVDVKEFVSNEAKSIDEKSVKTDYDIGYKDALEKVRKAMNQSIEKNINGGRF